MKQLFFAIWLAIADLQQPFQHFSTQGEAIAAQQTLSLIQRLQLSTVALG